MTASLVDTLAVLGFRTAQRSGWFDILLPLWCSVRVTEGERLTLEPRFGYVSRSTATWSTAVVVLLLLIVSRGQPIADQFLMGFVILLGVIWDVYRYILTEHAMDTVRQVNFASRSSPI